ncbi:hypothetical protein M9458_003289, partial [Cirrhinus mrigala]
MDDPAIHVLLLEQGDPSLSRTTTQTLFLANLTHYPDSCLWSFYQAGLNTATRAQLSGEGPQESLATYIEWVLVPCQSSLTVHFADDDISPTPDSVPSPPSPCSVKCHPEPTTDGEPKPSATNEPLPNGATELRIASEPESVPVRELATSHVTEEVSVKCDDSLTAHPQPHRAPSTPLIRLRFVAPSHQLSSSQSSVAPAPPQTSGSPPRSPEPWISLHRQPFLHHGSSLCRLHCGPPSWLRPGSPLAPPAPGPFCLHPGSSLRLICPEPFCLLLGSSLCRHHHGL